MSVGALFSVIAGFVGMRSARDWQSAAKPRRPPCPAARGEALSVAFSGGAVMGLCVVGLGLFGVTIMYLIFDNVSLLTGFSLGASSIALFSRRVGGGIYTKAADVGADLVGKVEAGIPEDDPRNPAVIADNVGDNVGDVAGMGADLFESYVGSIISALMLGITALGDDGVLFTLLVAAIGIAGSMIGVCCVRLIKKAKAEFTIMCGTYISMAILLIGSAILSFKMLGEMQTFYRHCHRCGGRYWSLELLPRSIHLPNINS